MSRIFKEFGCAIGELDATRQVQRVYAGLKYRVKSTRADEPGRNMVKTKPACQPDRTSG